MHVDPVQSEPPSSTLEDVDEHPRALAASANQATARNDGRPTSVVPRRKRGSAGQLREVATHATNSESDGECFLSSGTAPYDGTLSQRERVPSSPCFRRRRSPFQPPVFFQASSSVMRENQA
jgi:hypothetical protein